MKIKYSIIVPAYNVEKYVEQALQSVLAQKVTNYECIIVNDGSTDKTLEVVEAMVGNNERFKIITQENQGLSGARNTAIRNASGEYLVFLDADDYLSNNALEIMERGIETHSDVTLFNFYMFDQGSDVLHEIAFQGKHSIGDKNKILDECMYSNVFWFAVWELVISRDFFIKNELWFCDGIIHEDELWTMKCLALSEKLGCVNEAFYCYRVGRPGALTEATNIKELQGLITVVLELENFEKMLRTSKPDMAEVVSKRCSQLMYKIIRRLYMYEDDTEYIILENTVCKKLNILKNLKKYNVIYNMCKLLGVNRTSHILKLVYKIKG